jgi:hypothetical protein
MNTLRHSATALLLTTSGAAWAAPQLQVCHTDAIPLATTNWTDSVSVPKFDGSLGVLLSVDFELTGHIAGSAAIESLDAQPSTVTTTYQAAITLTRPDTSVLVVAIPNQMFIDNLSAFDGTFDFGGTSGITHAGLSIQDVQSSNSTAPADLALFTGPGSIVLPVKADGTSTASGSGNLVTQFLTSAEAGVRVCYNYALDCNGNGIPDTDDIANQTSNDHDLDGIPDECQPGWRRFCEGDGSQNGGIDCPCNNNGGTGEGCDWGNGFGGVLDAAGVPSVSNDTLSLTASQVPLTPGFFMVGDLTTHGQDGSPFFNGIRCLANPSRIQKVFNGGTIPLAGNPSLSQFLSAAPGDTMFFQYWFRNGGGPCLATVNSTNAVEVTWGL